MAPRPRSARSPLSPDELRRELWLLTPEAVRQLDALAIERYGMASAALMESASRAVADAALELVGALPAPRVLILCGPGNNGGDGLAAARLLHNAGCAVACVRLPGTRESSPDHARELRTARAMGLRVLEIDPACAPEQARAVFRDVVPMVGAPALIIDAVFGTGLSREVEGHAAAVLGAVNELADEHACPVLAVDVPSGLDASTGEPRLRTAEGLSAVRADVTVTFVGLKPGLCALGAQGFVGEVVVADLGVPRELIRELGQRIEPLEGADESPRRRKARGTGRRPGPSKD